MHNKAGDTGTTPWLVIHWVAVQLWCSGLVLKSVRYNALFNYERGREREGEGEREREREREVGVEIIVILCIKTSQGQLHPRLGECLG